jgi:hypothetical protein
VSGGDNAAFAGGAVAGAGAVALVVGLVLRLPFAVPWAVLLAGGGYVVARAHHSVADGWAAVVGAALLLAAAFAAWSIASDARIHEERAVVLRQSSTLTALVVGAALVSFMLVGAAAVSATAGLLLTGLGVAAAVGAVAVILRLAR